MPAPVDRGPAEVGSHCLREPDGRQRPTRMHVANTDCRHAIGTLSLLGELLAICTPAIAGRSTCVKLFSIVSSMSATVALLAAAGGHTATVVAVGSAQHRGLHWSQQLAGSSPSRARTGITEPVRTGPSSRLHRDGRVHPPCPGHDRGNARKVGDEWFAARNPPVRLACFSRSCLGARFIDGGSVHRW